MIAIVLPNALVLIEIPLIVAMIFSLRWIYIVYKREQERKQRDLLRTSKQRKA